MTRSELLNVLFKLNEETDRLLSQLETYSKDQLNTRPKQGTWSPSEILQHLMLSETLSLKYCKKKLSFEPKLKRANFLTWLNGLAINLSLMSPLKFKAPEAVSSTELEEQFSIAEVNEKWNAQRRELQEFLEGLPEKYIDKEVYKHAFGVRLSLLGMLNFFKVHFRRHRKQLLSRL